MDDPNMKALVTWFKFAFWWGAAAMIQALIDALPHVQLTGFWAVIFVPLVGATLKALATLVATRKAEGI